MVGSRIDTASERREAFRIRFPSPPPHHHLARNGGPGRHGGIVTTVYNLQLKHAEKGLLRTQWTAITLLYPVYSAVTPCDPIKQDRSWSPSVPSRLLMALREVSRRCSNVRRWEQLWVWETWLSTSSSSSGWKRTSESGPPLRY